jgi:hypothetical protein
VSSELPATLLLLGFVDVVAAPGGAITARKPAWAASGGAPLRRKLPAVAPEPAAEGKVDGVILVPGAAAAAAAAAWAALAAGGGGVDDKIDEDALLAAAPVPAAVASSGDGAGCAAPARKACANCSCGCVLFAHAAATVF